MFFASGIRNGNRKISSGSGPRKETPSFQSRTCSTGTQAVHSSAETATDNATHECQVALS